VIRHRCIPLDSPAEWASALEGIPHGFCHTWAHCRAMHLTTGLGTYLYRYEESGARIVCPVSEREFAGRMDIVKPFGIAGFVGSGECAGFRQQWDEFVRGKGYVCGYLGLNPVFDFGSHFDPAAVVRYDTVHVLDLTPGPDALFANLSSGRRRQLKSRREASAGVVTDRPALDEFFVDNYSDFLRRKNAARFYFFSRESLLHLLAQPNVILVGAREGGRIVAVTVFAYTRHVADALLHVSLPEGRRHTAPLVWHGIERLGALGIPFLNLGGGGQAAAEYKSQFGCRPLPLRCVKQIYDARTYAELCRRSGADPSDTAGYFPAYRKPD